MIWLVLLALGALPSAASAQYDRYGTHEVTVPPIMPNCGGQPAVLCFSDTTRHFFDPACCMRGSSSSWLILGTAGDSLELYAKAAAALLSLELPGARVWQEHLHGGTASFVRLRLPETNFYLLDVTLDLSESSTDSTTGFPYELRVKVVPDASRLATAPVLRILGGQSTRVVIRVPRSDPSKSPAAHAVVRAGEYRIFAPAIDSLDVCRVPCRRAQRVSLRESSVITVQP